MDNSLKRIENESDEQYFYRICTMKETLGFTWPQMAEIFNNEFGCSKGDTAYRKQWAAFNKVFNANADKFVGGSTEIQEQIDELYKAKRQLADQRREYNKILTSDARADHLAERLIEAANLVPLKDYSNIFTFKSHASNEEAVLCLSDWHYGQVSDNIWNQYDTNICVAKYAQIQHGRLLSH